MIFSQRRFRALPDKASVLPWLIWMIAATFFCYGVFQRVTPQAMFDNLMRDLDLTGAALGNLTAFYYYAYASLQFPGGVALDRFGPRRVLTIAALVCGTGSLVVGIADSAWIAYLGRLLVGCGAAFAFIGTMRLATTWFPANRMAFIAGLTAAAGGLGALIGQTPLALVVGEVGWRVPLIGAAAFAALIAGGIWAIARDAPSADSLISTSRSSDGISVWRKPIDVLLNRANWSFPFILAGMVIPYLAFAALWGVPFMMQVYGLEKPEATFTMSIFIIGHCIGAPFMGWFSDFIRRRKLPLIVGTSVTVASLTMIIYIPDLPLPLVYAILFVGGLTSGSTVICFAAARELNRSDLTGSTIGFVNFMNMAISAAYQPLIGWLLDLNWDGAEIEGVRVYSTENYRIAMLSVLLVGIGSIVAAFIMRETHCRPQVE